MSDQIQPEGASALSEHFAAPAVSPVSEVVADVEHVVGEVAGDAVHVESDVAHGDVPAAVESAVQDASKLVGEVSADVHELEHPAPVVEPPVATLEPEHVEPLPTDAEIAAAHGVVSCPVCAYQFVAGESREVEQIAERVKAALGL